MHHLFYFLSGTFAFPNLTSPITNKKNMFFSRAKQVFLRLPGKEIKVLSDKEEIRDKEEV
jgi:uncharacterized protein YabE (DUF348 family)